MSVSWLRDPCPSGPTPNSAPTTILHTDHETWYTEMVGVGMVWLQVGVVSLGVGVV